ncbi:MAG TPA: hypothetical protein VF765_20880 [Polyangiaceae bacterium]
MPIVGPRPESGLRVDVERPMSRAGRAQTSTEGGPPWTYAGEAATPEASHAVEATVDDAGRVSVRLGPDAPEALVARVRALLQAACKNACDDGRAPPRRIVRWRPEG